MTNANLILYFIHDRIPNRSFLVNTGAGVSVLPPSSHKRFFNNPGPALVEANGSFIKTYGKRTVTIELPVGRFRWTFVVANVSKPLLEAGFFESKFLVS